MERDGGRLVVVWRRGAELARTLSVHHVQGLSRQWEKIARRGGRALALFTLEHTVMLVCPQASSFDEERVQRG